MEPRQTFNQAPGLHGAKRKNKDSDSFLGGRDNIFNLTLPGNRYDPVKLNRTGFLFTGEFPKPAARSSYPLPMAWPPVAS